MKSELDLKSELDPWTTRLHTSHPEFDAAIAELSLFLTKSLHKGLSKKPGVNEAFIEDIVQISLLKILDKLDSFQRKSKFTTWALTITMRTAYADLRKKHWDNVSLDDDQSTVDYSSYGDNSLSPSEKSAESDLHSHLHSLIKTSLTDRQRDILLAELSGMPQDEIAAKFNTNRNAIYKVFHDARKTLHHELTKTGYTKDVVIEILTSVAK